MNTYDLLDTAGKMMHLSETGDAYERRHGIRSKPTLTVISDEIAAAIAERLEPRIRGKVVIDVGGGTGLLGCHLAAIARRVFVIEAHPLWAAAWIDLYHEKKPRNLSYLFGAATEFVGIVKADVGLVVTHSDLANMMAIAGQLALETIDVYGEIIDANPEGFDPWAREARKMT
jgi:hypothetical protein